MDRSIDECLNGYLDAWMDGWITEKMVWIHGWVKMFAVRRMEGRGLFNPCGRLQSMRSQESQTQPSD